MEKEYIKARGHKIQKPSPLFKSREPIPDLMDLAGKFKVKSSFDPVKTRKYMEKNYVRI